MKYKLLQVQNSGDEILIRGTSNKYQKIEAIKPLNIYISAYQATIKSFI